MVINSGAFKQEQNGRSYVTDGIRKHTGPFIVAQGPVTLPPASITTQNLVPSAAQEMVGSYAQAVSWTLPQTNVWTETPIQVTCQFSGAISRFEFSFLVSCPTKGARIYWVIMLDGTNLPAAALGGLDAPEANYGAMCSGTFYATSPPLGVHRVGVALYGPSGSQLFNQIWSTLYVTEQKR